MYDVAIIGGGPVGIFSIFSCSLEGLSCCVLDSNSELGGQCKMVYASKNIYDIPAYKSISGKALIDNLLGQIECFKYDVFLNFFASSIEEQDNVFIIHASDNRSVMAKSLIIALGVGVYKPVKLSVPFDPNLEYKKILYSLDDINLFRNKEVAVLGGGDSAIDFVLSLSKVADIVHLIHRRDSLHALPFSVEQMLKCKNVIVHTSYNCKSVRLIDEKLLISGDTEIMVDYVFPCYGSVPNVSFLKAWNLDLNGSKILVNYSSMQTSRAGVFAIGDCIYYEGKRNLIVSGFAESMIASRSIFKFLYPKKSFNIGYSTSSEIFKNHNSSK